MLEFYFGKWNFQNTCEVQTKVAVYLCKQMNEHNKTILEYKGLLMNSFEQKFETKVIVIIPEMY